MSLVKSTRRWADEKPLQDLQWVPRSYSLSGSKFNLFYCLTVTKEICTGNAQLKVFDNLLISPLLNTSWSARPTHDASPSEFKAKGEKTRLRHPRKLKISNDQNENETTQTQHYHEMLGIRKLKPSHPGLNEKCQKGNPNHRPVNSATMIAPQTN